MKFSNINIQYHGFHPSNYAEESFRDLLEEIRLESPQNAHIKASFSKKDELIKGILQIQSHAGSFFATATESNLREVSEKMLMQIRKRVHRWRTKRFKHESLKSLNYNEEATDSAS